MSTKSKVNSDLLIGLDLIAITYIRCKNNLLQSFENSFFKQIIIKPKIFHYHPNNNLWYSFKKNRCDDFVLPFLFATTAGAFDYIVCYSATSTFVITQFCSDVLRSSRDVIITRSIKNNKIRGFGKYIIDTHTTVAVDNNPHQKIEKQLLKIIS